jgi:hypothetical protein
MREITEEIMAERVSTVRTLPGVLGALLLVCLAPGPLRAQEVSFSLGAGWYQPGGADFDETDGGVGYHASAAMALTERVEVGVGAQWSIHGVDFSDDDYDIVGVFVEPRAWFGPEGTVRPYLAARLAWVRESIAVERVSRAADGIGGAGEVGLAVALTPTVQLEGGVSFALLSFGDFETDAGTLSGTESSGRAVGVRLGVRVRP